MPSIKRPLSKPPRVIKLPRLRRQGSVQNRSIHSTETNIRSIVSISAKVYPTDDDKVQSLPTVDNQRYKTKSSLFSASEQLSANKKHDVSLSKVSRYEHSQLTAKSQNSGQRNDHWSNGNHSDGGIAPETTKRQRNNTTISRDTEWFSTNAVCEASTSDFDLRSVKDPIASTITFGSKGIGSIVDLNQVLNSEPEKRKRKKRKKPSGACCCPCTPLCILASVLAAMIFAVVIAAILLGVLIKSTTTIAAPSSTRTSSTMTSTSSTSSTSTSTQSTTTTTSRVCNFSCLNKTWISSLNLSNSWPFDGTFLDVTNSSIAVPINNLSFVANGYVRQALSFTAAKSQYIYTSYIPLSGSSFTIEAWLYPTGFPNTMDHSIFGLCTIASADQCLHLVFRKLGSLSYLYLGFYGDDCHGNTAVTVNTWIHVAFLFDTSTRKQSIYFNGILDATCTATGIFTISGGNATIGHMPVLTPTTGSNFFQGYIDQLTITLRVKSSCEILDDATLTTFFNFNTGLPPTDAGPNSLVTTSTLVSIIPSGHSAQAISFNASSSYMQIADFTGLGIVNQAFSISLWIRPYSLTGTVVFISSTAVDLGWCVPFIGFATNGSIVAQTNSSQIISIVDPNLIITSVWSHIVQTWSSTNGLQLYVNNVLVAFLASATSYSASSVPNFVTLANRVNSSSTCVFGLVDPTASFKGDIDDFRVYNREVTIDDVCALYYN